MYLVSFSLKLTKLNPKPQAPNTVGCIGFKVLGVRLPGLRFRV